MIVRRLGALVLVVTAALLVAGDAAAARWEPSRGPEGGPALAVAVAPSSPEIVYLGTGRGVFKSVNAGRSWTRTRLVQPPGPYGSSPPGVTALVVDPRTPTTVYAGLNGRWVDGSTYDRPLFKTTNGGRTWRALGLRGQPIGISPAGPPTVYAAAGGSGGTSRLLRSTDAGLTWRAADDGLPSTYVWALAFDPTAPATVYAAMGPQGLFASGDGGGSWRKLGVSAAYGEVTAVAVDPRDPRTVYAGTDAGVIKSLDGGGSWRLANAALGGHGRDRWYGEVSSLVVDPRDPRTVYATTFCTGVFRSTDGGRRWSRANGGLEASCGRRYSLAIDPLGPSSLYATDSSHGVFKSSDGGARWLAANSGLSLSTVFSLAVDSQRSPAVYAAAGGLGLFKSSDGGVNWRSLATGPKLVDEVAVDPSDPRIVLAVAAGYGIFRSPDAGRTWAGTRFGVGARRVNVVAISGRTAYAGSGGFGLFRSSDGGRSWHELGALGALGVKHVEAVAIAPGDASVVYAGSDFGGAQGLFKSTDGGSSWQPLTNTGVGVIALDPTNPATLYIGALGGNGSIFRSTDGGTSWRRADAGLPRLWVKTDGGKRIPETFGVSALSVDPAQPATLYAAVYEHGVFRSTDSGRSWHPLNAGLPTLDLGSLALDATGRTLFAGTSDGGVVSLRVNP
jgi:photosystem II stability/assembly factor-like uncharacterized protein